MTGPEQDSESDKDGEPLMPRADDVEFSSGEDSDEGPRPADESGETLEPEIEVEEPRAPRLRAALQFLDEVDPRRIFRERGAVMKSVPMFLKRSFRNALKFALEEASAQEEARQVRGWKLLVFLPGCCCTVALEVVWSRSRNWSNGSNCFREGMAHSFGGQCNMRPTSGNHQM